MNLLGLVGIAVGNPLLFLADQAPKVHRVSLPIRLLPTCVVHCFPQRRCLYKTHIFGKQVEVWRPDTRRLALVEHTQWCKGSSFNCSVFSAAKPAYKIWPWVFFSLNWLEIFRFAVAVFWPTFKTWSLVSKRPVQVYGNRFPPFVHRVKMSRRLRTSTSLITTRQTPSTERHHSRICPVTTGTDGKKTLPCSLWVLPKILRHQPSYTPKLSGAQSNGGEQVTYPYNPKVTSLNSTEVWKPNEEYLLDKCVHGVNVSFCEIHSLSITLLLFSVRLSNFNSYCDHSIHQSQTIGITHHWWTSRKVCAIFFFYFMFRDQIILSFSIICLQFI